MSLDYPYIIPASISFSIVLSICFSNLGKPTDRTLNPKPFIPKSLNPKHFKEFRLQLICRLRFLPGLVSRGSGLAFKGLRVLGFKVLGFAQLLVAGKTVKKCHVLRGCWEMF